MITRNKILISFMLITSTFSGLTIPVFADDNNVNTITENVQTLNDENDIIADSDFKFLNNLDKVHKYLGYDYKVPDYIPDTLISAVLPLQTPMVTVTHSK